MTSVNLFITINILYNSFRYLLTVICILFCEKVNCQVGINTQTPKATLDINSNPNNMLAPDGIIAPRLTGDQLKAKDNVYNTDQVGALVYVTEKANNPVTPKTINVNKSGYYMFDGIKWVFAFGENNEANSNNLTGVLVQLNQSSHLILNGVQSYGLLMHNAGVTISPTYDLGVWSSTTQTAEDVISSDTGDNGALLIEKKQSGSPTFYRISFEYLMGNTPPLQTRYFTIDILDNDTGGHIFTQSIVVPGGLNTGHVAPFSIFFSTIPDNNLEHKGYKVVFGVDTAGSQGLPNNISVKMNQILKID
jgi:hypothetical protein